ncbi:MAG: aspartate 1-decarboxylase [Candidatus Methylomirabilales bacterium]
MHRIMLVSKIHRAVAQAVNLEYEGSITIDDAILTAADILPYQQVQVYNVNSGTRFETYAIAGEGGSGTIVVNGAAARLVQPGDRLIIAAYALVEEARAAEHKPRIVLLDEQNRIAATL